MSDDADQLRVFVALPRTGSTLFMRIMAGYPEVGVTSRNVLRGNRAPGPWQPGRPFKPDYSLFTDPNHPVLVEARIVGKTLVVSKEELGHDHTRGTPELNEANFPVFPDQEAILKTRPVFTFRDARRAFDSWLAKGWDNIESFVIGYKNSLDTFEHARAVRSETVFYTYEYLVESQQNQIRAFSEICKDWAISFDERILRFTGQFGANFIYRDAQEKSIYASNPKGLFARLIGDGTVESGIPAHGLLTQQHADLIDREVTERYSTIHTEVLDRYGAPRARLARKPDAPKPRG